ncbi:hypothetical protein [Bacillus licheniformis]|uniref:hypothetical protein n=1 Tax=Bacillus licheniformis TaxID=1402 RepID=UPI001F10DB2A|nr:hypothetical protein [Bacillus licheniformis]
MSDNINFFSKASSCLLYFADSVRCFAKAVELTDESDKRPMFSRSRDQKETIRFRLKEFKVKLK